MTCRELIEFLWRYTEDDLTPAERATFDAHLARCPHCAKYVQSYQETIQIGKVTLAPSEETVPTEVPEDLIKAILAARSKAA
jgi:anti-sigma factor RsiW